MPLYNIAYVKLVINKALSDQYCYLLSLDRTKRVQIDPSTADFWKSRYDTRKLKLLFAFRRSICQNDSRLANLSRERSVIRNKFLGRKFSAPRTAVNELSLAVIVSFLTPSFRRISRNAHCNEILTLQEKSKHRPVPWKHLSLCCTRQHAFNFSRAFFFRSVRV